MRTSLSTNASTVVPAGHLLDRSNYGDGCGAAVTVITDFPTSLS
jgi:hypothetical protein